MYRIIDMSLISHRDSALFSFLREIAQKVEYSFEMCRSERKELKGAGK